jgi:NAD(P)-dependent dehydrogenase (short-subunit alcohol dehydrogenase family)
VIRTILITGATGKIGRALVHHFAHQGDVVIAAGRSGKALDQLASDLRSQARSIYTLRADLLQTGGVEEVVSGLTNIGVHPDCIVNNARNASFLGVDHQGLVSRENFLREFELDVVVPYELVMALASKSGVSLRSVVNIGSQYGTVAPNLKLYVDPVRESPLHYGVSKAALAHLTKELAVRLAPQGVRVNCVALGGVEGRVDDAFARRYAALCPGGRMLREDEVAGPVDMLLSDAASAITGHILVADNGWSVW